ncbi:MAG: DUF2334 domain-containing protein [Candidatus Magasanikbacteria bacterium]|nr:DUF2334 domain-containing protein [Candidatus Magasanikbacteria bacterium]
MLTVRIDDIGASSKHFEQHGRTVFRTRRGTPYFYFPLANVGFFKRTPPFKRWGPYDELTADEWTAALAVFREYDIVPIVAITAAWVDEAGRLISFPEKFPAEAAVLKQAAARSEIIVANHGLTHCVVGRHLPRVWSSNRYYHREFYDWLPQATHDEHVHRAQKVLETYFARPVTHFIPPGNIWSQKTYRALQSTNITQVIANRYMMDSSEPMFGITFVDDRHDFFAFHDREIKIFGMPWLESNLICRLRTNSQENNDIRL